MTNSNQCVNQGGVGTELISINCYYSTMKNLVRI